MDSTELDSVNDDVVENDDEDVDLDEESSVLKNCNNSQGTTTRSRCFFTVILYEALVVDATRY